MRNPFDLRIIDVEITETGKSVRYVMLRPGEYAIALLATACVSVVSTVSLYKLKEHVEAEE